MSNFLKNTVRNGQIRTVYSILLYVIDQPASTLPTVLLIANQSFLCLLLILNLIPLILDLLGMKLLSGGHITYSKTNNIEILKRNVT